MRRPREIVSRRQPERLASQGELGENPGLTGKAIQQFAFPPALLIRKFPLQDLRTAAEEAFAFHAVAVCVISGEFYDRAARIQQRNRGVDSRGSRVVVRVATFIGMSEDN